MAMDVVRPRPLGATVVKLDVSHRKPVLYGREHDGSMASAGTQRRSSVVAASQILGREAPCCGGAHRYYFAVIEQLVGMHRTSTV